MLRELAEGEREGSALAVPVRDDEGVAEAEGHGEELTRALPLGRDEREEEPVPLSLRETRGEKETEGEPLRAREVRDEGEAAGEILCVWDREGLRDWLALTGAVTEAHAEDVPVPVPLLLADAEALGALLPVQLPLTEADESAERLPVTLPVADREREA